MPNMDCSNASMEDLKVPHFASDAEKSSFLEAMYAGEVPIPIFFQAMGVDFTDHEYAAEAIRIGGIPFLSSAAPGFAITANDLSHLSHAERGALFLDENDRKATEQVQEVHAQHSHAILGGNAMKKLTGFNRAIDAYGSAGNVDTLAAGAGILESADMQQMQQYSGMELMPIVSSSTAARWTVRVAKQINARIRLLLVELPQFAGGHLGAGSAEDAVKAEKFDPVAIREGIRKFAPTIPVVLAGGIAYRNQIKQALAMGYQGVGIGIRGLLTQESKLDDAIIRDVYLNPRYRVVTNDRSPTGYPGRYIEVPEEKRSPEARIAYAQHAVRNCISCIEPGSCLFLQHAKDPTDEHFCIGKDLPDTRFGKRGGVYFASTERDRIMHDPIYRDAEGNPRVPSMEEMFDYMLTHDAPPMPVQEA
ncbi:MAG: nitronate monooxygenase [Candidatus Peribacteraceae bacterium]|jgi:nitronate monooxygenase|nr:nitronate monooxygenase [Candidatus Peribacteraceae bacterium]